MTATSAESKRCGMPINEGKNQQSEWFSENGQKNTMQKFMLIATRFETRQLGAFT